ncbi:MAG: C39 family peptidase [Gemmatimonadaceae bacterium]
MNWLTHRRILSAVLATVLSSSSIAAAQPTPIYVRIPRADFEVAYAEQANSNWCWAASIQMILNYYGISIKQQEIVGRSYGGSCYKTRGCIKLRKRSLSKESDRFRFAGLLLNKPIELDMKTALT